MRQYAQLHLTCADADEATRIADALLERQLIVCAKQVPVASKFRWQGEIEEGSEVLLIMDSAEDLFPAVEAEVSRHSSYETFVLQMLPLVGLSSAAAEWADANLRPPGRQPGAPKASNQASTQSPVAQAAPRAIHIEVE